MLIGSFSFHDIESTIYNLVCKSVKRPLLSSTRVNRMEVAGVSGAFDVDEKLYSLRTITMHIAYIGTDYFELRSRAREIAAWLGTVVWSKLIINDEPDKYYLAKVTSEVNLETLWESGGADVDFDCQPFAFSTMDTDIDPTWDEADFPWIAADISWGMMDYIFSMLNKAGASSTTFTFNNLGTATIDKSSPPGSKSLLTLIGSWTSLSITLNGKTLTYGVNASSTVVIDNIDMTIVRDSVNVLNSLTGDLDSFLPIIPGINEIVFAGTNIDIVADIDFTAQWF